MLPSPTLGTASDKIGIPQATETSPKKLLSPTSVPEPAMHQFEFDQHVLLSPPTDFTNPFDDEAFTSSTRDTANSQSIANRNAAAHALNARHIRQARQLTPNNEAKANRLEIQTDLPVNDFSVVPGSVESDSYLRRSTSTTSLPKRTPSLRAALHTTAGSLSPGSTISSPQLAAMLNITPLPSPIEAGRDPWRLNVRTRSRGSSLINAETPPESRSRTLSPPVSPPKRKAYEGLRPSTIESQPKLSDSRSDSSSSGHVKDRSVSEYVPDAMVVAKPRNVAVSSNLPSPQPLSTLSSLHREEYLAVQRGFLSPSSALKSPAVAVSAQDSAADAKVNKEVQSQETKHGYCTATSIANGRPKRYKLIRILGQGTFSKVFLAVREVEREDGIDYARNSTDLDGVRIRSRRLVAIKVVEQGPAGGADSGRVQVSLRREVEVLKAISHPSLVYLKAFGEERSHSLLVLNYCPGGDLFEVASSQLHILVPSLVRRIFAELVSAVRYLHQKYIVHRDIKLENILLNIPSYVHSDVRDWQTLDRAVITLTDLGLSRRVPEPPESPLLATRCGSEDYAAPELLMGQLYDGRQTDAWALGVVLYALMEGRLPFDPLPGARGDPEKLKARTPHRIARCDWAWYKHGDADGDWDPEKGKDYEGARPVVEGLLKRNSRRKGLDEIREMPWVNKGIVVDGGLRRVEEEAI